MSLVLQSNITEAQLFYNRDTCSSTAAGRHRKYCTAESPTYIILKHKNLEDLNGIPFDYQLYHGATQMTMNEIGNLTTVSAKLTNHSCIHDQIRANPLDTDLA